MKNYLTEQLKSKRIRILYIQHVGILGGSSRSLLELIQKFDGKAVDIFFLGPKGKTVEILHELKIPIETCIGVSQFDNTKYSHYRGFRWLILLRELAYLPSNIFSILRARKKWGPFDLIHINEITLLPSILFVYYLFRCPIVVHVRSIQQPFNNFRGNILFNLLKKTVDRFIAIDSLVAKSLDARLPINIIHNGLTIKRNIKQKKIKDRIFTVGMVGSLSKSKGCLDFIDAAKLCKEARAKIRFVFIGQSARPRNLIRDNILNFFGISQEIESELNNRIYEYDLAGNVEFWPFTINLENVYKKLDLVCFPSHFNAPGRPIFEAALFGIPSVATISSPTSDTFIHNKTGLLVHPGDVHGISTAILKFYRDRRFLLSAGRNAKSLANRYYNINKNSIKVLNLYKLIIRNHKKNAYTHF